MSLVKQTDIQSYTTISSSVIPADSEDEDGGNSRQCPLQKVAYNVVFQDLHTEIEKLEEKVSKLRESEYKLYTENELLQKYKLMIEKLPKDMQWDYATNEWIS